MVEKKIKLKDAYSLKTPQDSIKLYKKWANTYDKDFALSSNYVSPNKICDYFKKYSEDIDTPILDVGAGTGLLGELLYKEGIKDIYGIDISSQMLSQAKKKKCYSKLVVADLTKQLPFKDNYFGAIISAGTFTHGHVGPKAINELLRITKSGGLFVISINSIFYIKAGFKEKFINIKNKISSPIFKKFKAHGNIKNKAYNQVDIFASIFRKK